MHDTIPYGMLSWIVSSPFRAPLDTGRCHRDETSVIRASISLVVSLHANGETFEAGIKRADEALYQAKNSGRSRWDFME
jgi:PleD family two-component response regulator